MQNGSSDDVRVTVTRAQGFKKQFKNYKFILSKDFLISQLLLYIRRENQIRSDLGLFIYDSKKNLIKNDMKIYELKDKLGLNNDEDVELIIDEMSSFGCAN